MQFNTPMVESVYIDNNASGNLDNGDLVWGNDPNDLFASCFDVFDAVQTFDWEVIAAQLGSVVYTGATEAFRGEPGSEAELMIDNIFIVDGDGYDNIKW